MAQRLRQRSTENSEGTDSIFPNEVVNSPAPTARAVPKALHPNRKRGSGAANSLAAESSVGDDSTQDLDRLQNLPEFHPDLHSVPSIYVLVIVEHAKTVTSLYARTL